MDIYNPALHRAFGAGFFSVDAAGSIYVDSTDEWLLHVPPECLRPEDLQQILQEHNAGSVSKQINWHSILPDCQKSRSGFLYWEGQKYEASRYSQTTGFRDAQLQALTEPSETGPDLLQMAREYKFTGAVIEAKNGPYAYDHAVFQFEQGGGNRVVSLPYEQVQYLAQTKSTLQLLRPGFPPTICLWGELNGVLSGALRSRVTRTPDRRPITNEATVISMMTGWDAMNILSTPALHDPCNTVAFCKDFKTLIEQPPSAVWVFGERAKPTLALDVLRWNGYSEEDIEGVWILARMNGCTALYEAVQKKAAEYTNEIHLGVHPRAARIWLDKYLEPNAWLPRPMDFLQSVLGPLDFSPLYELRELLLQTGESNEI